MKVRIKKVLALVLFSIFLAPISTAFAQEGDFGALINAAKEAYEAENYPVAIDNLVKANWVQPNARLLLNIAKSHEKSGNCIQGLVYYRAFVRADGTEPALLKEAKAAIKKSKVCAGWSDLFSGRTIVRSEPMGATVSIDGIEVGTTPIEIGGLDEGDRVVVLTLDTYDRFEQTLTATRDTDAELSPTLVKTAIVEDEDPVEVEPEETAVVVKDAPANNTVDYIIGGSVATVGLGLIVFGAVVDSGIADIDDDRRAARADGDTSEFNSLTEDRDSAVTTSLIGYIGGGVLLAGGVGYLVYTLMSTPEPSVDYTFAPSISHESVGLVFSGKF